jgi:hypothetical protein
MALVSPGVQITISDESNYAPSLGGTTALVVIATEQDKTNAAGTGTAAGTTKANANKVSLVTSQRELVTLYGNPKFYTDSAGTPIPGYELNEYGLLAAYSMLGVANRAYVLRADIDTAELVGTTTRPTGAVADETYWLDTSSTAWGYFEWNKTTQNFSAITPIVITDTADLDGGVPKASIGAIGAYAVVASNVNNPLYYKRYDNTWQLVGSPGWEISRAAIIGTASSPIVAANTAVTINTATVTFTGGALTTIVSNINSANIAGVTARSVSSKLYLYASPDAMSNGATEDGKISISNSSGTPLSTLGITAGTYINPDFHSSDHTVIPDWYADDSVPRPTGSVWRKRTAVNEGTNLVVKQYLTGSASWNRIATQDHADDVEFIYENDAAGGGINIPVGTVYAHDNSSYTALGYESATQRLRVRFQAGATSFTSLTAPTFTVGHQFDVYTSRTGSATYTLPIRVTLTGTDAEAFVGDLLSASPWGIGAQVNTDGTVTISHQYGGIIKFADVGSGSVIANLNIPTSVDGVEAINPSGNSVYEYSGFKWLTYTASNTQPVADPADGTKWYFGTPSEVDIMIHDGTDWRGYHSSGIVKDIRGYTLANTDPAGVIAAASEPTVQSDGSALVLGDLWLDTSAAGLEDYPRLYRYQTVSSRNQWVYIDKTDQTSSNGIAFADARWDTDGTTDPIMDAKPLITDLLESDYLDIDAPNPALYPRGMLLWNTRRSGYNVKEFRSNYYSTTFPDEVQPDVDSAWVTVSGNKDDGSMYGGRQAVRNMVVEALKAALDTSTEIREEQRVINLFATPGYPETIANMVALNTDRKETGFVIGDSPMRLTPTSSDILNWVNNDSKYAGVDGLATASAYLGVFYPSGLSNDLSGNAVVVPASHMALRTLIKSDANSYPWFAPAGVRRGLIDNATALGYIDSESGELVKIGVSEGLRDTLYENAVNPLTFLNGVGLCNYGNKTRSGTTSALDRINVARLITYLRMSLNTMAKGYIFEPNDKIIRDQIKQATEGLLNDLVAKRAIYDYVVVCDTSNNTPSRIDRNELYVDIAISPVKSVEFIYIPIRVMNTGAI